MPAAAAEDSRSSGNCVLWAGVTDQLAVSVNPQIGIGTTRDGYGVAQEATAAMSGHPQHAS
ncbi:hypothetical protein [Amycolatopsis rubida]|uniref:hypothetical protein n=1 Tax=Amycolatopsis rubida TaxID=112413 RepID=UPI000AAC8B4B|nr:hypothetical protein [Amycolatopsis rubida]